MFFLVTIFALTEGILLLWIILNYYRYFIPFFRRLQKADSSLPQKLTIPHFFDLVADKYTAYTNNDNAMHLLKVQAELDAMQTQINPHFLYNTLDSIRGQALEDGSTTTAELIGALSSMFRYTISQKKEIVTLEDEIKCVETYIQIQQYRYQNKFQLIKDFDSSDNSLMEYPIPKLVLQPIIENCIYHGLRQKSSDCTIKIHVYTTQSHFFISISDNGAGMDNTRLKNINDCFQGNFYTIKQSIDSNYHNTGVALINVNSRIRLIYGDDYGLTIYSSLGIGTEIQIALPLYYECTGVI